MTLQTTTYNTKKAMKRIPWNKGKPASEESRKKMSLNRKGKGMDRIPWNKGIRAWNHGLKWPDEVKENISRGMVAYWIQRKESKATTTRIATSMQ